MLGCGQRSDGVTMVRWDILRQGHGGGDGKKVPY